MMKPLILALFAGSTFALHAQTIIDVNFPDGTGTNPTFLEIDNGLGGGTGTWTQSTGVLFSTTANNSTTGAASDTNIDFTALGPDDALVLNVEVSARTGTNIANGMFIGFQQRNAGGVGADLWNNNPPSFGLVIPGNASGGLIFNRVSVGGSKPSAPGRYQVAPGYGVATGASMADGFSMTLTVGSAGWDLVLSGLEDAAGTAITGGSGDWGVDGVNEWAEFNDEMRAGFSYQTNASGGDLSIASVSLTGDAPLSDPLGLDVQNVNGQLEFSWVSSPGKRYNLRSVTDPSSSAPKDWPIYDGQTDIRATPDINSLTVPLSADLERFFVVEEFPAPPVTVLAENFDDADPGWTTGFDGADTLMNTVWQLGDPTGGAASGPTAANSAPNCYGTNLSANYGLSSNTWLRSPSIDLTSAVGATLTFQHWVDIDDFVPEEAGTLRVLDASVLPGTVTELAVVEASITGINLDGWAEFSAELPAAAIGQLISLEFVFVSDDDGDFDSSGWYIDDVLITAPGS